MRKNKIILVDWDDSCSYSGWKSEDDFAYQPRPLKCQTVGYLINESKTAIAIAQSKTLMEGYKPYGEIIHILKSGITRKVFLENRKPKRRKK